MLTSGPNVLDSDDVYEPPTDANIVVDVEKQTIPEIAHCKFRSASLRQLLDSSWHYFFSYCVDARGLL